MRKSEYAFISQEASKKGIRLAVKDKGADKDSGWRFFYSMADYKKNECEIKIKKRELLELSPKAVKILNAGRGSIYQLLSSGWKRISKNNSIV